MGMELSVFVEPGGEHSSVAGMFREEGYNVVTDIHEADFICFIGGSDVDPSLYYEENTSSYTDFAHDLVSLGLAKYAEVLCIPIVGICRGGQFITSVIDGYPLTQHVDGHRVCDHILSIPNNSHYREYDGILVTSDHHQAITQKLPMYSLDDGGVEIFTCPDDNVTEVVISRGEDTFALAYQPHPEWVGKDHPCRRLFFAIIENEFKTLEEDN